MSQTRHVFETTIEKKVSLQYLLYLPKGYGEKPGDKWPLVLFLHGMGERGSDLDLVKKHGIPKIVMKKQDYPFVAVSPQCPMESTWPALTDELHALLVDVMRKYKVDESRVYLTGLSMGGYGAWYLASAYPKLFAAVVPICGGMVRDAGFQDRMNALKRIPIWIFHGEKDKLVPVQNSKDVFDALKKARGRVKLTLYPDLEHDSWTRTYDNPELYEWLLKQKRPQRKK